ncbi:transcription factor grauzone-like [Cochliomyia hominivorax]
MSYCLLCLERYNDDEDYIEIDSPQWNRLNISNILEQHFWSLIILESWSSICLSCWDKLQDFHKFYMQVEKAHVSLENVKNEKSEFQASNVEVNEENEQICSIEVEIVADHKTLQSLEDGESYSQEIEESENSSETNMLIKNYLKESECTKDPGEKVLMEQNSHNLQEKSDHNDHSDTSIANEEDSLNNEEFDGLLLEYSNLEYKTSRDNDEFIVNYFKQIYCDLCQSPLANFNELKKHFLTDHNQRGYIQCCNRKYLHRPQLVEHLQWHINPDYFKCSECGKVLSDRYNLKNHILRVHRPNNEDYSYCCDICGKTFAQSFLLRLHKITHGSKEGKEFPCNICGKFYKHEASLRTHTQVVHLKQRARICDICGKTCSNSTKYKDHMKIHHTNRVPTAKCDECGLRLIDESALRRHQRVQHPVGGKQEYKCNICNQVSTSARALQRHTFYMHKKGFDHKCSICAKSFKRAKSLKEHMARHTGNALYSCSWCSKTFNSSGNFNIHRKKSHPKEWELEKLKRNPKD